MGGDDQAPTAESLWQIDWLNGDTDMHITPPDDLVGHELDPECVCGPYVEDLGGGDTLYQHQPLDGRP